VLLPFAAWELTHGEPVLGAQALWLVLVAALIPGIGSYWIYGWTQKILGAGPVAMTMYLGPLYAAVVAWLVLDEALGLHHLAGGALILAGVALVMAGKKGPVSPDPAERR
jgi:drug/metabolite transporter (DMT)-like permease